MHTIDEQRSVEESKARIHARLRASIGDYNYNLWNLKNALHLERVSEDGILHCTLPTPQLTKWVRDHYAEDILRFAQEEFRLVRGVEFTRRTMERRPGINSSEMDIKLHRVVLPPPRRDTYTTPPLSLPKKRKEKDEEALVAPPHNNRKKATPPPSEYTVPASGAIAVEAIIEIAEEHYDLAPGAIVQPNKSPKVAHIRGLAMSLASEITRLKPSELSKPFNRAPVWIGRIVEDFASKRRHDVSTALEFATLEAKILGTAVPS